jgi:hypothetical protein
MSHMLERCPAPDAGRFLTPGQGAEELATSESGARAWHKLELKP